MVKSPFWTEFVPVGVGVMPLAVAVIVMVIVGTSWNEKRGSSPAPWEDRRLN
jgi:hypothetical protein